jgi:hypothetical protein
VNRPNPRTTPVAAPCASLASLTPPCSRFGASLVATGASRGWPWDLEKSQHRSSSSPTSTRHSFVPDLAKRERAAGSPSSSVQQTSSQTTASYKSLPQTPPQHPPRRRTSDLAVIRGPKRSDCNDTHPPASTLPAQLSRSCVRALDNQPTTPIPSIHINALVIASHPTPLTTTGPHPMQQRPSRRASPAA